MTFASVTISLSQPANLIVSSSKIQSFYKDLILLPKAPAASFPIWKAPTTGIQDRIRTLKGWMHTCLSNHRHCSPTNGYLPKRLIDAASSRKPRIVMVDQLDAEDVNYATLSYCWGASRFGTTKDTERLYSREIPWDCIPRTLQDALDVTHALQIPYLWIDSLCIVQDDLDEWEIEAAKMQNIYAGSSLTIAATDSSDSSGGLATRKYVDPGSLLPQDAVKVEQALGNFFAAPNKDDNTATLVRMKQRDVRDAVDDSILSTRGWVLQEVVLSHRIVHFMDWELFWTCRCESRGRARGRI